MAWGGQRGTKNRGLQNPPWKLSRQQGQACKELPEATDAEEEERADS